MLDSKAIDCTEIDSKSVFVMACFGDRNRSVCSRICRNRAKHVALDEYRYCIREVITLCLWVVSKSNKSWWRILDDIDQKSLDVSGWSRQKRRSKNAHVASHYFIQLRNVFCLEKIVASGIHLAYHGANDLFMSWAIEWTQKRSIWELVLFLGYVVVVDM